MWMLLLRRVKCRRGNEIWFVVNGKPIRFSLLKYALISGLRCSDYPTGVEEQAKSQDFRNKHFPQHTTVTIGDLERKLKEMCTKKKRKRSQSVSGDVNMEKIKMAMLYSSPRFFFKGTNPLVVLILFSWVWWMILKCLFNILGGKPLFYTCGGNLQSQLRRKHKSCSKMGSHHPQCLIIISCFH